MTSSQGSPRRSEEIRRKRASQPRKTSRPSSAKRSLKTSAPPPPAVLVRGALASSMAQERRGKKKPKRRYDVALSTPGAEMRLPALPRLQIGWRLVSAALVIGLAYLLYTVWNSPTYRVLAAEVEGANRLTSMDINTVAGIAGKPIFSVEPEVIQHELSAAFPELSSVKVEISLPSKVTVTVEERVPVLVWIQEDKELWVDSSGVAFPPRGDSAPPIVVKAHNSPPGFEEEKAPEAESLEEQTPEEGAVQAEEQDSGITNSFMPEELVNAILIMSKQAPEGKPLVYTKQHGLGWEDKRGWEVYFGTNDEDMDMKLQVYKALVKRLKKDDVQPEFISVEYVHAPYYRLDR